MTDPAALQTFTSGDVPKTIADPNKKDRPRSATSQLTPSGTGTVVDTISVDVTIDHTEPATLTVSLTSPQDTAAALSYDGEDWQIDNPLAHTSPGFRDVFLCKCLAANDLR